MYMGATPMTTTPVPTAPLPWYQKLLTDVAPQALTVFQQYKLNQENLSRARAGQPGISAEQYRLIAPPAQLEVGVNPESKRMLLIGAAVIGAVVLVMMMRQRPTGAKKK